MITELRLEVVTLLLQGVDFATRMMFVFPVDACCSSLQTWRTCSFSPVHCIMHISIWPERKSMDPWRGLTATFLTRHASQAMRKFLGFFDSGDVWKNCWSELSSAGSRERYSLRFIGALLRVSAWALCAKVLDTGLSTRLPEVETSRRRRGSDYPAITSACGE